MKKEEQKKIEEINRLLRYYILDMTTTAGSGHPTSSLSAVELMSSLMFGGAFHFDISEIDSAYNDRIIFSKGHASPLFYALWAVAGAFDIAELQNYRKMDGMLEGHPTKKFPFTEAATGSLGQGLSVGVGMALAQKKLEKTNARTYVLLGDSEMAEGQVWEAMQIASHYKLDNLIAIVDVNRLGQRGETMLGHDVDIYAERARAFGWRVVNVDGHDVSEIHRVYIDVIGENKKPLMIIGKTYKGRGVSFLEDKYSWHGKSLSEKEFADAVSELGYVNFNIQGLISLPKKSARKTQHVLAKKSNNVIDLTQKYAVRDAYGESLVDMMRNDERVVVLDAEVGNSTRSEKVKEFYPERFFEMFIAEQNMVSVGVGLAQRGFIPFISSFAAFLTRAHDQVRMASLSGSKMVVVGSHCGVSIGEDGASQMGLDDIAMFRAMIGSSVFYPSDYISMQKLLSIAKDQEGVSYVRATREKTPVIYGDDAKFYVGGMNIVRSSDEDCIAVITAGITLHEALQAEKFLQSKDVHVRVIDLYSIKPIDENALISAISKIKDIIIVEDHFAEGGIGESVRAVFENSEVQIHHLCVKRMPQGGKPKELLAYEKIDFNAIIETVEVIVKK